MTHLAAIRERQRDLWLARLRQEVGPLVSACPGARVCCSDLWLAAIGMAFPMSICWRLHRRRRRPHNSLMPWYRPALATSTLQDDGDASRSPELTS